MNNIWGIYNSTHLHLVLLSHGDEIVRIECDTKEEATRLWESLPEYIEDSPWSAARVLTPYYCDMMAEMPNCAVNRITGNLRRHPGKTDIITISTPVNPDYIEKHTTRSRRHQPKPAVPAADHWKSCKQLASEFELIGITTDPKEAYLQQGRY